MKSLPERTSVLFLWDRNTWRSGSKYGRILGNAPYRLAKVDFMCWIEFGNGSLRLK